MELILSGRSLSQVVEDQWKRQVWEPSFTPASLFSEIVALFHATLPPKKWEPGRTPCLLHSALIGDRSASPISRSNERLLRPLNYHFRLLSWARSRVQAASVLSSRPHTSPRPLPGKGPPASSPRPLSTLGLKLDTPRSRCEHRTLPEWQSPRDRRALSPADLQTWRQGCSVNCPAWETTHGAPLGPYLLEKGPWELDAAGLAFTEIGSGCVQRGAADAPGRCAAGPPRPELLRARSGRSERSPGSRRLVTPLPTRWAVLTRRSERRVCGHTRPSPRALPATGVNSSSSQGRRSTRCLLQLCVSLACLRQDAKLVSLHSRPGGPSRSLASLLPTLTRCLRPRLSLQFQCLRSSPSGSPASRFAANLRMELTPQTFPTRLLQEAREEVGKRVAWT